MAVCNLNNVTVKTARSTAILSALGTSPLARFYTGTIPSDASVAPGGTLLAQLTCASTFGTVTSGTSGGASPVLIANTIPAGTGANTGVPTFCRLATSAGVGVVDLDCGATGSGASVIVSPDSITNGAPVQITSITITEG